MRLIAEHETALDYGINRFLFSLETPTDGEIATPGNGTHIAFEAKDRAMVAAFHEQGLANGGRYAGRPGLRPQYDPNDYAAFLIDPDGNKIEAVTYSAI